MEGEKVCLFVALKTTDENTSSVSSYQKSSDVEQNCRPVTFFFFFKFIMHPTSRLT